MRKVLIKHYGAVQEETRYSPAQCVGIDTRIITGKPDKKNLSTCYLERQHLTMRMIRRRFTRLTNGFSKKVRNHAAAIALHNMHCNFCRIHQTLRVTSAMEAGLTDHVQTLAEVALLLEARNMEAKQAKRVP